MKNGDLLKIMKNTASGYCVVILVKDSIHQSMMVHRLVAQAFLPPTGNPLQCNVNHLDGNKTHNNVLNLEWCTARENVQHASRTNLLASGDRNGARLYPERLVRGESVHTALLTEVDVRIIRKLVDAGFPQLHVARQFYVSAGCINRIVLHKSWKHVL